MLYNPIPGAVPWEDDNHDQMMVVAMMFAWHMAAVFIVMICIGAVVAGCQSRCGRPQTTDDIGDYDGYDGVRLLRCRGEMPSTSAGDYDAGLDSDSDSDTVDFARPAVTRPAAAVRPDDDIIQ